MKRIASLASLLIYTSVFATPSQLNQQSFWQDIEKSVGPQFRSLTEGKNPLKQRDLSLDENSFKQLLFSSSVESTKISTRSFRSKNAEKIPPIEINLPLPKGGFVRVKVSEAPVLSNELALSHPEIKTWRVIGVDDPAISGRLDFTTKGFHGMLVMADGETIFIDPDKSGNSVYHSLSKRDNAAHFNLDFDCEVHGKHSLLSDEEKAQLSSKVANIKETAQIPAKKLITYRLAVAATGEFTAKLGGNRADAYASIVTTINRVNQVYQRDIGVKLQLVTDEQYVYTDAATDPYTNGDKSLLVRENATNLATNLGVANFDIGHVFGQGALGGLAYVGVACIDSAYINQNTILDGIKGGGATGLPNPQGEVFSVDFVGHEIGHQLGAHHTFNSTQRSCGGGRSSVAAVEPGSGSTIMAYSGICGDDNLQFDADAMFHWKTIDQINNYTRVADPAGYTNGSSCGVRTSLNQQQPTANAGGHGTVPFNTPFVLEGAKSVTGSTYTWDQFDSGSASAVDVDLGNNAIIRSLLPSTNPIRYIPRLSDLFAATHTKGEQLPQRERTLAFAFTVRDGNGAIATMFKNIHVKNSNGFRVLSQSTAEALSTNQTINVDWNVGGTNGAPIDCNKVDIQLLRVNGTKNMLLAATDNDGGEQFVIPATTPAMSNARIMVACSSQPFFQISTGSISIEKAVDNIAPVITLSGSSNVEIVKGLSYTDAGATATDDVDSIVSVVTTGTVDTTTIGTYTLTYTATDNAGNTASKTRTVTVITDAIAPVITLNGLSNISIYKGVNYVDAGAVASDNVDVNVIVSSSGSVDTNVLGSYTITYVAIDSSGNKAIPIDRTVTVIADTTAPVITLNSSATIEIFAGTNYSDAGAVAVDNLDGAVAVSSTGAVDTATLGSYEITYTAVDNAGNTSTVKRTVNVIADTTAPIISLNGSANISIFKDALYGDAGATATDNKDGLVNVVISGTVDTSVLGAYTITYTATDNAGNNAQPVTRTVNVVADTVAPVITLNGDSIITVTQDSTYVDTGAIALDNVDGIVTVSSESDVDTAVVGMYTITYKAVDSSGNTATKDRVVIVEASAGNGSKQLQSSSSGGGSFGLLLLPLALLGLRRRLLKLKI